MNVETINKKELNTEKLKHFLIDEIKKTLKAPFDEKSNSDKIKDDFSLKIGKAIADGIDEWIKGAVKPTEIDTSGIEDSVKEIQKEIVEYVERRWNDVTQTMQMLQNSMLGFSEGINPITIQTMQIAVGDESLQFRFVDSKVNPETVDHIVTYNGQDKTLTAAQGIIQHMTMGITEIKAVHTDDEYLFWDVKGFTSHVLESTKPYYLYIRADKTSSDADFVLSEIAFPLEWSVGYYHFLTGILNSEYENTRAFVPLYGFTEILPGRITTDKIVSQDGKTYFDLLNSVIGGKIKFLSGTEEKDLEEWSTEIDDITGNILLDIEELDNLIADFDEYIDGAFHDGIIEEAEAKAIEKYINQILSEKVSLEATYNKLYMNPLLSGTPKTNLLNANDLFLGTVEDLIESINDVIADGKVTPAENQSIDSIFVTYRTDKAALSTRIEEANKAIQDYLKSNVDAIDAKVNLAKAITDKFGTTIDGGLISTVVMLLRELNSTADTAGISGIQGSDKDLPAIWAGGTYEQANQGTAKSIIRHDGSGQLAGGNIEWDDAGNVELSGKIASGGGISTIDDKIKLNSDGSGHLADGNILWDELGDALIKGTIRNSESLTQFVQLGSDGEYPQITMRQSDGHLLIGTEADNRSTPMVKIKDLSNSKLWSILQASDFVVNSERGQSAILGGSISVLKSSGSTKFTVGVEASNSILRVVFVGLPTSPTGLSTGQLYKDTNGFLKIV